MMNIHTHTHTAFFLSVSLFSLFPIDTFFMGPQRLPPNHLRYKLCTCKVSGLVCELWWRGEGELKYKGKGAGEEKAEYAQVISLIARSDTVQKLGQTAGKLLNDCHLTGIKEF